MCRCVYQCSILTNTRHDSSGPTFDGRGGAQCVTAAHAACRFVSIYIYLWFSPAIRKWVDVSRAGRGAGVFDFAAWNQVLLGTAQIQCTHIFACRRKRKTQLIIFHFRRGKASLVMENCGGLHKFAPHSRDARQILSTEIDDMGPKEFNLFSNRKLWPNKSVMGPVDCRVRWQR